MGFPSHTPGGTGSCQIVFSAETPYPLIFLQFRTASSIPRPRRANLKIPLIMGWIAPLRVTACPLPQGMF